MRNVKNSTLHISIGVAPSLEIDLTHELNLVKVALLYSDKATLCSPSAFILGIDSLGVTNTRQRINHLIHILPIVQPDKIEENKKLLLELRERHLSGKEIILLNNYWSSVRETISKIIGESNSEGLSEAASLGYIKYKDIGEKRSDKIIDDFVSYIKDSVERGDTHPLLDDTTGELVRVGVSEGTIQPHRSAFSKGKQVHLASDLFSRLPLFDAATIPEVIDIRKELDKYLVRFRSGTMRFSEQIRSASWDIEFPSDADDLYRKDIEPTIRDIEDEVESNKYLKELLFKLMDKDAIFASSFGLAVSKLSDLPELVSLAFGVSAAGITAYREWSQRKREIEKNHLYFYYGLREKL